ncbi:hypothetical protein LR48_Vigan549s007800 [Vigna angularis]|uniref:non-specific serine/threonine protein kinase n=1 Tax=Phaseolus angularis TaxID=3914 RepID=A0A0L9TDD1_PHAAN|nr:hypothetical protein LR48_Vigan549s007800 [Vigna angularis]
MASDSVHLPLITIFHHSIIFLLLFKLPSCLSSNRTHSNCANLISCGQIRNIGFPFWGGNRPRECGHPLMELICENEISYITIKDVKYQVLEANPDSHTLKITRQDYSIDLCQPNQVSTSLDTQLYVYESPYNNLTLSYGCTPSEFQPPTYIRCNGTTSGETIYSQLGSISPVSCKTSVVVPVPLSFQEIDSFFHVYRAIKEGFVVRWIIGGEECDKCEKSGGECGFEGSSQQTCYCRDGPCPNISPDSEASSAFGYVYWCRLTDVGSSPKRHSIGRTGSAIACLQTKGMIISPFQCANLKNLSYPFWGLGRTPYCGHPAFNLQCTGEVATLTLMSESYRVLEVNDSDHRFKLVRTDYWNNICPTILRNITVDGTFFDYGSDTQNLTFYYDCPSFPQSDSVFPWFNCSVNGTQMINYFVTESMLENSESGEIMGACKSRVVVPILESEAKLLETNSTVENLKAVLDNGFGAEWDANNSLCDKCQHSGGYCGHNPSSGEFMCYCRDESSPSTCKNSGE